MDVEESTALTAECDNQIFYFCSEGCKERFLEGRVCELPRTSYDLIIVGGGPAGLTAAVYADMLKIDAFLLAKDLGGQAIDSTKVENYMGYDFITGPELTEKFQRQLIHSHYIDHLITEADRIETVKGGFNVLEGVRHSGTDTRLICFSSTATYDVTTCPRTPVKEDLERKPLSLYGMNKILIEDMVRQYHFQYDIPYTIIRPNYVVAGPEVLNIFRCGVVKAMLKNHANDPKCQLYNADAPDAWKEAIPKLEEDPKALCIPRCCDSDCCEGEKGSWRWHMTDVRDVVALVDECLVNDAAIGQTFNIAAADAFDWDKYVPYIAEITDRKCVEVDVSSCWQFSFDQSASKELLGFTPKNDHKSIIDTAKAMADGEDVGIIPGEIAPLSFE